MASENDRFLQELLNQLAARQADAEFAFQKAALTKKQEEELKALEDELQELDALERQMQQVETSPIGHRMMGEEECSSHLEAHGRGNIAKPVERQAQEATGSGEQINLEEFEKLSSGTQEDSTGGCAPDDQRGDAGKPSEVSQPSSTLSCEPAAADRQRQMELELTGEALEGAQAQIIEGYEQHMRRAEEEAERERLVQDQRAQQRLHERRQRLLEKRARLEAEQKEQLEVLEKERQLKQERLQHQLQQDLVDFSIEFEIEPQELDKLSRHLWSESQQRYQKQLRDLEKKHAHEMESAYEDFLKEWTESHNGDLEASSP